MSPDRFKITFTASSELKDKLERLQALTQKDLVATIEAAVTEKLERLEAKRYGEAKKPRKSLADTDTSPKSRYIPAAVRRLVFRRDGKQCTFVDENGRRCREREGLEFHHDEPYGLGGDHDPRKIRLLCRRHNFYEAERDYGKGVMDRYRKTCGRVSETASVYGHGPASVFRHFNEERMRWHGGRWERPGCFLTEGGRHLGEVTAHASQAFASSRLRVDFFFSRRSRLSRTRSS